MTRIGNYTMIKNEAGYRLTGPEGNYVGTYPTARRAADAAVTLIAAAYKAAK